MNTQRRRAKEQKTVTLFEKSRVWLKPALITVALLSLVVWGGKQLNDPGVMPVRTVGVDGEMRFIKRERLEQVVAQAVNGSFFSVDLKRMQEQIERMAWVKRASVRRVWPDTLRVQVTEHAPLAYWGKDAMVSQLGVVFTPEALPELNGLVKLVGDAQYAKTITREFQRMHTLLDTVGLKLTHVWVDARQAWSIKTDNRVVLQLGRRDVIPRLTRFVRLYPDLIAQQDRQPGEVDLRYTNGFSVHWLPDEEEQTAHGDQQKMGLIGEGAISSSADSHYTLRTTGESHG
ncbi:MAG: FtsQ-type POTRA domain-containing protein [Candidatus Thiodiazotropha sp. DIVDIV]